MAVYYLWSGATGTGSGATWANAFTTLTLAFATEVAGDTIYVAHDHAESTATAISLNSSGTLANVTKIVCVNRSGSVPPVSADRRTTAQVSTTLASNITLGGSAYFDGIIFSAGSAANSADVRLTGTTVWVRFDNCSLRCAGTGATSSIDVGLSGTYVEFNNTTVSFAAVGQSIGIGSPLKWRNTASALLGTIPTALFLTLGGNGGEVECIGVDFSAAGSGKTIVGNLNSATSSGTRFRFVDCKLNASVTKSQVPLSNGGMDVDFIRTGATGVNYTVHSHRITGLLVEETTVVRSGGATDGTTPIAWKIDTTANANYLVPFECPVIAVWNDTTGSAKTATIEGIWGGGAVPNDDDIWIDVEYLGDASSPQGSFVNDGKADLLATAAAQTSSSVTWGGSTTKFKLNVTFTAQQKGWIYCRVKCAKTSSTFYIDPLVTLT